MPVRLADRPETRWYPDAGRARMVADLIVESRFGGVFAHLDDRRAGVRRDAHDLPAAHSVEPRELDAMPQRLAQPGAHIGRPGHWQRRGDGWVQETSPVDGVTRSPSITTEMSRSASSGDCSVASATA